MKGIKLVKISQIPPIDRNLFQYIQNAEKTFYENDKELLQTDSKGRGILAEMSMVFRFGIYLQSELNKSPRYRDLSLDSEYNKHFYKEKPLINNEETSRIRPDLCLHERRTNENNLLVIEFKKENNSQSFEDDRKKLKALTLNTNGGSKNIYHYGYKYGLFVVIYSDHFWYELYQNEMLVS